MLNAPSRPKVSVITRTMGQRLFLTRVLTSLAAAAPPDTQWVVVNDSGQSDDVVAEIIEQASNIPHLRPLLVHSAQRHRAKAMNAGLAAAEGDFIHILDDDDTVEAEFYAATITALNSRPETSAIAVRSCMVEETISADSVVARELRRTAHFPELKSIAISMMLVQQMTPMCSLLFRSRAIKETGPFCEDFEVCEDYEFILRFLLRHDIGLIDRLLCAFHTRIVFTDEAHANSESSWNHAEVDARFRNALLRRSLSDPSDRLGFLMLLGDLARGAVKLERATVLLRRYRLWNGFYRVFRKH